MAEIEAFDVSAIQDPHPIEVTTFQTQIQRALDKGFGESTPDRLRYSRAEQLHHLAVINLYEGMPALRVYKSGIEKNIEKSIILLRDAIKSLHQDIEDELIAAPAIPSSSPAKNHSADIFVVHGHDHHAMEKVRSVLVRLGLNPIVLQDEPNGGRTIIEKFEANSQRAGFAVVLLTPDDVGGPIGGQTRPRARQNVILELKYFYGALGRKNVCAFVRGDPELPSDFVGIACEQLDDHGAWQLKLARELRAGGYTVDLNKLG